MKKFRATAQKMNPHDSLLETLKSFLLTVLFILMLLLTALNIYQSQNLELSPEDVMPIDSLLMLKNVSGDQAGAAFNREHIIPGFIGYKLGNIPRGIALGGDIAADLNRQLSDAITGVLGNTYVCESTPYSTWTEALRTGYYVYIRYSSPLPAPILYAYYSGAISMDISKYAAGEVPYISEILLKFTHRDLTDSGLYSIYAIARDPDGNIFTFTPSDAPQYFDINRISAYDSNSDLINYEFAINLYGESCAEGEPGYYFTSLEDSAIVFSENAYYRKIKAYQTSIDAKHRNFLLKLFDYNPDMLSEYHDIDGAESFVELHGRLTLTKAGTLSYSASDKKSGLDISRYLSYGSYSGNYSTYDILKASGALLDSIRKYDKTLLGGGADIKLHSFYIDDSDYIVIKYAYYYDNIPLCDESSEPLIACEMTLNSNRISELYIRMLRVEQDQTRGETLPQLWTLDKLNRKYMSSTAHPDKEAMFGNMHLAYKLVPDSSDSSSVVWVYECARLKVNADEME